MRYAGAFALLGLGLVVTVVACENDGGYYYRGGRLGRCEAATTCQTCTPLYGCGWCSFPNGDGACVDDPDYCAGAKAFSWTWEADGCRSYAEAGVGGEGGAEAGADDEGGADAGETD